MTGLSISPNGGSGAHTDQVYVQGADTRDALTQALAEVDRRLAALSQVRQQILDDLA